MTGLICKIKNWVYDLQDHRDELARECFRISRENCQISRESRTQRKQTDIEYKIFFIIIGFKNMGRCYEAVGKKITNGLTKL